VKKVNLSIIIVSYNTKELLRQCLRSLMANSEWRMGYGEIIVVDNGSTDGSREYLKRFKGLKVQKFKVIFNDQNLGFAKANNQGIKIAQGKYILLLNSDTVVPKQTIPKLISYLEENPKIGVITPKLELRSGEIDLDCHRGFPKPWAAFCYFSRLEKLFSESKIFGQYHQTWKNLDVVHEIDSCCGAFLLTRKKILNKIGGLDESYFFYGEDLDLCYRIKKEGWKVIYYPKVKAIHYKGASSGLRRESKDVVKISRDDQIKVTKASIEAMEIFYDKFYKNKYPLLITFLVKLAIKVKKALRLIKL